MFGKHTGSLHVLQKNGKFGEEQILWSKQGQHGDMWYEQELEIEANGEGEADVDYDYAYSRYYKKNYVLGMCGIDKLYAMYIYWQFSVIRSSFLCWFNIFYGEASVCNSRVQNKYFCRHKWLCHSSWSRMIHLLRPQCPCNRLNSMPGCFLLFHWPLSFCSKTLSDQFLFLLFSLA